MTLDEMGSEELVLIFVAIDAFLCSVLDTQFCLHRDFCIFSQDEKFLINNEMFQLLRSN